MLKKLFILLVLAAPLMAMPSSRPDAHAPIGVMADHTHHKESGMVSYRFMNMQMNSLYNRTNKISLSTAQQSYMMNPTDMTMSMHMIGGMYGYSNKVTLTAMINYLDNQMTMVNMMNVESDMASSGFSDLKLGAIIELLNSSNKKVIGNIGLSLPFGAINETNDAGDHLPYGMQLGSGTYDLIIGSTGTLSKESYSLGAQGSAIIRLGKNKYDYRLGNQYQASGWFQKVLTEKVSTSIRSSLLIKTDISGQDDTLSAMQIGMSPMYNTNQGQILSTIGIGLNYKPKAIKNTRFATEYIIPIFHHTDAITLVNTSSIVFGIQKGL